MERCKERRGAIWHVQNVLTMFQEILWIAHGIRTDVLLLEQKSAVTKVTNAVSTHMIMKNARHTNKSTGNA